MIPVAEALDQFDGAMRDIYRERTGLPEEEVRALMAAETFFDASASVEKGFADGTVDIEVRAEAGAGRAVHALRRLDVALAKQ
ncbi:MAG: ATP-dependent Clp protease proteolytic subunit, partial [Pseudomonadota bacterium]